MPRLNHDNRQLVATLVLTGPRQSGKSAVLRAIRDRVRPERLIREAGVGDEGDLSASAPLDWLALDLGTIGGWLVRVDLYSVSGSHAFDTTRRLLLSEADGLLLVLDSQAQRLDDNLSALREIQDELLDREGDLRDLPQVFAYTKQDLPSELVLSPDALDDALNFRGAPSFGTDSHRGEGVLEPLHSLVTLVMRRLSSTSQPVGVGE